MAECSHGTRPSVCNAHFPTRGCGGLNLPQRSRHERSKEAYARHADVPSQRTGIVEHWCDHSGCKRWGSFGHQRRYGTLGVGAWIVQRSELGKGPPQQPL